MSHLQNLIYERIFRRLKSETPTYVSRIVKEDLIKNYEKIISNIKSEKNQTPFEISWDEFKAVKSVEGNFSAEQVHRQGYVPVGGFPGLLLTFEAPAKGSIDLFDIIMKTFYSGITMGLRYNHNKIEIDFIVLKDCGNIAAETKKIKDIIFSRLKEHIATVNIELLKFNEELHNLIEKEILNTKEKYKQEKELLDAINNFKS